MDYTGHLTLRSLLPGPTTGVSYQSLLVPFKHVSLYLNHTHTHTHTHTHSFLGSSAGKEPACNVGDPGSIPGSGRSLGEGKGYPLQYSCPENSMGGRAWQATVYRVSKSWT